MRHDQDEEEDVFDENGILKDGKTYHVPMRMMDSLQRAVHDHAAQILEGHLRRSGIHEQGFLRDASTVDHRKRMRDEYARYDREISEQWKNPWHSVTTTASSQDREVEQPLADARLEAYRLYEKQISERWRGDNRK